MSFTSLRHRHGDRYLCRSDFSQVIGHRRGWPVRISLFYFIPLYVLLAALSLTRELVSSAAAIVSRLAANVIKRVALWMSDVSV